MVKRLLYALAVIAAIAGFIATYHGAVTYFETKAHAAAFKAQVEDTLAMVQKGFQEHLVWEAVRRVKSEMYEIEDRNETKDPMGMDPEDRDRYRELQEELEYLKQKMKDLKEQNGG